MGHEGRVANSALWAAWGDALGFITERADARELKHRIGSHRVDKCTSWRSRAGGRFGAVVDVPQGAYSDDTELRLATSRAIKADGVFDVQGFAKVELPVWRNYALGGGKATRAAADSLSTRRAQWYQNHFDAKGIKYFESGGNGAAMRVQPHVWASSNRSDWSTFIPAVVSNAVCTHGHPRGFIGAVFHALCVAYAMNSGATPGPDDWARLLGRLPELEGHIREDEMLGNMWLPYWEERTGWSIGDAIREAVEELAADVEVVTGRELGHIRDSSAYESLLRDMGCLSAASRGSGTKTSLAAAVIAYAFESNPAAGILTAANCLGSDTDTIATMAGALLGCVTEDQPGEEVLDAPYLLDEARRLSAVGESRADKEFFYPDLLTWEPNRSQVDAVVMLDGRLALDGLGYVERKGEEYLDARGEHVWQWSDLPFGQSVLIKYRSDKSRIAAGKGVGGYREVRQFRSPVSRQPSLIPEGENEKRRPEEGRIPIDRELVRSVDEAVRLTKDGDYDPAIIGRCILELGKGGTDIESVIAYAAIIVHGHLEEGP